MSKSWRFFSLPELQARPEPKWLLKDILPEAGAAVLYGRSGVGKSFLALDWMLSVATGTSWEGHPSLPGPVVYVCAENAWVTWKRAESWAKLRGRHLPMDQVFVLTPDPVLLAQPDQAREFLLALAAAKVPPPRLVVLDTLQRNMAGADENSTKDMTMWVSGLQVLLEAFAGATVLVVHHSGKDPTKGDRGSTVLRASVETVIELSGDRSRAMLVCHKQKNAPEFKGIGLARKGSDTGFIFIKAGLDDFDEKVLAVIREHPAGISASALRKAMGGKDKVNLRKLQGALEQLAANESIIEDENKWWPYRGWGQEEIPPVPTGGTT